MRLTPMFSMNNVIDFALRFRYWPIVSWLPGWHQEMQEVGI